MWRQLQTEFIEKFGQFSSRTVWFIEMRTRWGIFPFLCRALREVKVLQFQFHVGHLRTNSWNVSKSAEMQLTLCCYQSCFHDQGIQIVRRPFCNQLDSNAVCKIWESVRLTEQTLCKAQASHLPPHPWTPSSQVVFPVTAAYSKQDGREA